MGLGTGLPASGLTPGPPSVPTPASRLCGPKLARVTSHPKPLPQLPAPPEPAPPSLLSLPQGDPRCPLCSRSPPGQNASPCCTASTVSCGFTSPLQGRIPRSLGPGKFMEGTYLPALSPRPQVSEGWAQFTGVSPASGLALGGSSASAMTYLCASLLPRGRPPSSGLRPAEQKDAG